MRRLGASGDGENGRRGLGRLRPAQLVFANAGVGGGGGEIGQIKPRDWQWTLGVKLMGMIHTVDAFLPTMPQSGAPGHVVYTASMAGMIAPPIMGSSLADLPAIALNNFLKPNADVTFVAA